MYNKLVPLKIEATIKYPQEIVEGFKFMKEIFQRSAHYSREDQDNALSGGLYMNEVLVFHNKDVSLERWADHPHFCLYPREIQKIENHKDWTYYFETNYVKKPNIQMNKVTEYCVICDNKQILKNGQKYILEFKGISFILDRCSLELIQTVINTVLDNIQYLEFIWLGEDIESETEIVKGIVTYGFEGELVKDYFNVFAPEVFYA